MQIFLNDLHEQVRCNNYKMHHKKKWDFYSSNTFIYFKNIINIQGSRYWCKTYTSYTFSKSFI